MVSDNDTYFQFIFTDFGTIFCVENKIHICIIVKTFFFCIMKDGHKLEKCLTLKKDEFFIITFTVQILSVNEVLNTLYCTYKASLGNSQKRLI